MGLECGYPRRNEAHGGYRCVVGCEIAGDTPSVILDTWFWRNGKDGECSSSRSRNMRIERRRYYLFVYQIPIAQYNRYLASL